MYKIVAPIVIPIIKINVPSHLPKIKPAKSATGKPNPAMTTQIIVNTKNTKERLYRADHKYDYIITINHNYKKIPNKGSAVFIHLTDSYNPTSGCVALKKKDFEILLKLINKKTKIKFG